MPSLCISGAAVYQNDALSICIDGIIRKYGMLDVTYNKDYVVSLKNGDVAQVVYTGEFLSSRRPFLPSSSQHPTLSAEAIDSWAVYRKA